ncbi:MAG TPA: tRNA-dihydrouridine synthase family protein, partial [Nevskiaceae bacterium]|nr:tRNA-dihydrouridine synthase family protein [Nevskiaceae bacterium]
RGGAILLREPELLERIVRAVRAAVPAAVPVTAKMRLGYEHTDLALDCARALESGGAAQLVVHARTKVQGYQPPAHWEWIARIREAVAVTVYANGEIWSVADWQRCRAVSGAADFMLGRGLVALPDLARQVRAAAAGQTPQPQSRGERLALVERFWQRLLQQTPPAYAAGRLKQWWVLLMCGDRALAPLWSEIKRERDPQAIGARLAAARAQALSEEATSSATRSPDSSAPST